LPFSDTGSRGSGSVGSAPLPPLAVAPPPGLGPTVVSPFEAGAPAAPVPLVVAVPVAVVGVPAAPLAV